MTSPIKNTMRCYLNVMVGTGWLRVGLVSQPGMRSFDVADEGGGRDDEGEGPLGRRGEGTPSHSHRSKGEGKETKMRRPLGGGRTGSNNQSGQKGFFTIVH